MFLGRMVQYHKVSIFPQMNYTFNATKLNSKYILMVIYQNYYGRNAMKNGQDNTFTVK